MKRYRLREQMNGIPEPPGKVWFWELAAGVIDAGRCIQCGTCVAACPSNSIGVNKGTGCNHSRPRALAGCSGRRAWEERRASAGAVRRSGEVSVPDQGLIR